MVRLRKSRLLHARSLVLRAAAIAAVGCLLGLAANALHPMGLPLALGNIEGPGIPRWVWRVVPNATPQAAHRLWQVGEVIFLDTRDADDYAEERIPGSINLPFRDMADTLPRVRCELPTEAPILIYCYGSHCGLAMRLAKRLLPLGYEDLSVMRGGIAGWEAAGYELESGAEAGQ